MKKILLFALLFVVGCNTKSKYTYTERSREGSSSIIKDTTIIIEAENDIQAYKYAYNKFSLAQKVRMEVSAAYDNVAIEIPIAFLLYNDKEENIAAKIDKKSKDSVENNIDSVLKTISHFKKNDDSPHDVSPKYDSTILASQKIAYGNIQFGMKEKEFDKLKSKDAKFSQIIGSEVFFFNYEFDNNSELYFLRITGLSKDANYIETEIKEQTETLIDVLTKKYGQPEYLGGFPSILSLRSGMINFMSSWEIGNKVIKVGVGEEQRTAEFYSSCWIYDKIRNENYQNIQGIKDNAKKSIDASKF